MDGEQKQHEPQMGRQVLAELIIRLKGLQEKPSCFAMAAAADLAKAFEKLFTSLRNFHEKDIELARGVVSVALINAATEVRSKVGYEA